MIPYMAGGYAIDRMMGGDGKMGLALGTGAGAFGTGAIGGSALTGATASTAGSTSMMMHPTLTAGVGTGVGTGIGGAGMTTIGANTPMGLTSANSFGTVNPLTTGGVSESISPFTPMGTSGIGGNVGFLGQPISNQAVNSSLTEAKGLLDWGTENSFVQDGFDFINDGWEGMSLMDKANTGMLGSQAIDAANPEPQYPQVAPPQIAERKPLPTSGNPLSIQVGKRNTEFVDPEQLYKDRYG
jgi:hypothetical protein